MGAKKVKVFSTLVGRKDFTHNPVTVGDPCCDNGDTRLLEGIHLKPGCYSCCVWRYNDWRKDEVGKRHCTKMMYSCNILLRGASDKTYDYPEHLGNVAVDAGLVGIYQNKPNYDDEKRWFDFCRAFNRKQYGFKDDGFICSTSGDGCFGVYALRDDAGEIVGLEIRFH